MPRWRDISDGFKKTITRLRDRLRMVRKTKVPTHAGPVFRLRPLPPLPLPSISSVLPVRSDREGWEKLGQQSRDTATKHAGLALSELAYALQEKNTKSAVAAMYRLRSELLIKSGGNVQDMYALLDEAVTGALELLQERKVAMSGDYLNRLQNNLLQISRQRTPEGDRLDLVMPSTASQSIPWMHSCLQLVKEKLKVADLTDEDGRLRDAQLEPEMVQACVNVLSASCTPIENITSSFLQTLQGSDPTTAADLLDEWLLLAREELVREGIYPDDEKLIDRVTRMIPICGMSEAQRQTLTRKLSNDKSRLSQWLLLVNRERESRKTDLKLNALNTLHEKLLQRLLSGDSVADWQKKHTIATRQRVRKSDRLRVQAIRHTRQPVQVPGQKKTVEFELKLPSCELAGSLEQLGEQLESTMNDVVAEMISAAADQNTRHLLLKSFELQQLILRYGRFNQMLSGADDSREWIDRGLAKATLDPDIQQRLQINAAYIDDVIRALPSLCFTKLDNGERVADHLSGSAQGIVNFTAHLLFRCLETHCPDYVSAQDEEASTETIQDCFTTLYGLETPMEGACIGLQSAMLEGNLDRIQEKAMGIIRIAEDDLRALGQDASDTAVLETVRDALIEMTNSGQELETLKQAYKDPGSPLWRDIYNQGQKEGQDPLISRLVFTFHDTQVRRLGLGDGISSLMSSHQQAENNSRKQGQTLWK